MAARGDNHTPAAGFGTLAAEVEAEMSRTTHGRRGIVDTLLDELPPDDAAELRAVLHDPKRYTSAAIARVLQRRGHAEVDEAKVSHWRRRNVRGGGGDH